MFSDTLLELARRDPEVMVVTSDSRGSGKLVAFGESLPEQIVEVGIAEQNLVGVAAGLASSGRKVFAVSPACFLTARSLEQIKNDICYSDHPVVLVGISAGVSYGALGSTHHSLHDFAVLRAIHNIDILAPADAWETEGSVHAGYQNPRPTYIRLGKRAVPPVHGTPGNRLTIGKAYRLREGTDAEILATGETVWRAVEAARLLETDGISAGVTSFPCIRPLDEPAVLEAAGSSKVIVTVEEHLVHGGLGEACAAVLARSRLNPPFEIMAIPDADTVTGSQEEILEHYGIVPGGIADRVRRQLA